MDTDSIARKRKGRTPDITNQKFGRLTALYRNEMPTKRIQWWCKCDCGSVVSVDKGHLRSGHTTSCGCFRKETIINRTKDLTGQQFGRWTVLKRAPE